MRNKILIGPSTFGQSGREPLKRLCDAGYDVVENPFKRKLNRSELIDLLTDDVIGIVAGLETLDREVIARSSLRVISRCGSGTSNVDKVAASELGIKVYSTPDAPTTAVAELTVCAVLSLLRQVHAMNAGVHSRKWDKTIGVQLKDKIVAIIGFGRIGRKVSELLVPFGVHMFAVDPALSGNVNGVRMVGLDEALKNSDIIVLHASGENVILGRREFQLLKKGAYLLNAARGGLIDEDALVAAIEEKRVSGVWLDAFNEEPYSGPLCDRPEALLTPHIGSYTVECRRGMEDEAVKNLIEGLKNA